MKIMIVDDQTGIRTTLKEVIDSGSSANAVEFIESSSDENIFDEYETERPDYVLLATELKNQSGFKVARDLIAKDPEIKIVLMSSFDMPAFRKKAEDLQVKGFVLKESLSDINDIIRFDK